MELPEITQVKNLKGKRVLIRVDFNVPIAGGKVAEDFRIKKVLPILQFLRDAGAKIIILSHIGREKFETLLPVSAYLANVFPHTFIAKGFLSKGGKETIAQMKDGDAVMFENLRQWDGEKNEDSAFAAELASFGDLYVNEAFPVSHRKDASVYLLPQLLPSYFGPAFLNEVNNLTLSFTKNPPFLFIIGGAKFETKIPLITKYLEVADTIFIGGALANDFFKLKGYETGTSLVDEGPLDTLKPLLENPKFILPVDVVVDGPQGIITRKPDKLLIGEKIMDIGAETVSMIKDKISKSAFILWNGPLGVCEKGFDAATLAVAGAVGKSKAEGVVGGGDTVAAIEKNALRNPKIFVSSAGGAMLDFLANGTLPGIEVVIHKEK